MAILNVGKGANLAKWILAERSMAVKRSSIFTEKGGPNCNPSYKVPYI